MRVARELRREAAGSSVQPATRPQLRCRNYSLHRLCASCASRAALQEFLRLPEDLWAVFL